MGVVCSSLPAVNRLYMLIVRHFYIVYRAVKYTFKPLLKPHGFKQHRIPNRIVACGITVHIVKHQFLKYTCFAAVSSPPAPIGHILISEEQLPPNTGLSCIRTTLLPLRAAAISAAGAAARYFSAFYYINYRKNHPNGYNKQQQIIVNAHINSAPNL